ncbi:MAG TPA: hypothetical protein VJP76_08630 [Candidatus Tumulicola sp.]|nr:hypothetical protein [Candidatus Tumulicola sp.]
MKASYTAWIGQSACIAENVSYDNLLAKIDEFTVRAAISRTIDRHGWEQDELRRAGLTAFELFHNGKAVWRDPDSYEESLREARRERVAQRFTSSNELNPRLIERLDADLQLRWRMRGFLVSSLCSDMRPLFAELEETVRGSILGTLEGLVDELLAIPTGGR